MIDDDHPQRDWTLKVSNLGRVSKAQIEIKPLVLLVGRNNTGKSYVASTIWALHDIYDVFRYTGVAHPPWYKEFCQKAFAQGSNGASMTVTATQANGIAQIVNESLRNAPIFLSRVFRFEGFAETEIEIIPTSIESGYELVFSRLTTTSGGDEVSRSLLQLKTSEGHDLLSMNYPEDPHTLEFSYNYMFGALAASVVYGGRNPTLDALYLPAGRTGLLLAQKAFGGGLALEGDEQITVPTPVANFMNRLSRPKEFGGRAKAMQIANWLEATILKGRVVHTEDTKGKYLYQPSNKSFTVPFHATSSMISELAPFLLMLRRDTSNELIVFEEPEAHLHLSAQRAIARALARLINNGHRVVVTTHSDTFVQQINNLIQLHGHPHRTALLAELGYTDDDVIDPAWCSGYEFTEDGDSSSVLQLKMQTEGFSVPSLNDTLFSLANETLKIQEDETR